MHKDLPDEDIELPLCETCGNTTKQIGPVKFYCEKCRKTIKLQVISNVIQKLQERTKYKEWKKVFQPPKYGVFFEVSFDYLDFVIKYQDEKSVLLAPIRDRIPKSPDKIKAKIDLTNYIPPKGKKEMLRAVKFGKRKVFQTLLQENPNIVKESISQRNNRKALHKIAQYWNKDNADLFNFVYNACPEDLFYVDSDGNTPLHLAIKKGNVDAVKALVNKGARLNIKNNDQFTPLELTSKPNKKNPQAPNLIRQFIVEHTAKMFALVEKKGSDTELSQYLDLNMNVADWTDTAGKSLIQRAVECNNECCVRRLMKFVSSINQRDSKGKTLLHIACDLGHDLLVNVLLTDPKIDVNASDNVLQTPLHAAIMSEKSSLPQKKLIVESLSSHPKIDLNLQTLFHLATPLHVACYLDYDEIVEVLLKRGAKKNIPDYNQDIPLKIVGQKSKLKFHTRENDLVESVLENNLDQVSDLLDRGGKVDFKEATTGKTLLFLAVEKNSLPMVQLLLKRGADPSLTDDKDVYPIIRARQLPETDEKIILELEKAQMSKNLFPYCQNRQESEIKRAVELCVDMNVRNSKGVPLLHYCVYHNSSECLVEILKSPKIDVNCTIEGGRTALLLAAFYGRPKCVEALIQAGAEIDRPDEIDHWSPLFWATANLNLECMKLLLSAGASFTKNKNGISPYTISELLIENSIIKDKEILDALLTIPLLDYYRKGYLLLQAAQSGDVNKIIELLPFKSKETDLEKFQNFFHTQPLVNFPDREGKTALHHGSTKGDVVSVLLDRGANVLLVDKFKKKPIDYAVKEEIKLKLIKFELGQRVLDAASQGKVGFIQECMKDPLFDINFTDYKKFSSLHNAVYEGFTECVRFLLQHGADPNIATRFEEKSPLHFAVTFGKFDFNNTYAERYRNIVKLLLQYGASPNKKDLEGFKPIALCKDEIIENELRKADKVEYLGEYVRNGDWAKIESILQEFPTFVNYKDINGSSLLHIAIESRMDSIIKRLLQQLNIEFLKDKKGRTPYDLAVEMNLSSDLIELIDKTNKGSDLINAAILGNQELVASLIKSGVDLEYRFSDYGWTAAHFAVWHRKFEIVKCIVSTNPKILIHSKDFMDGDNLLHLAAYQGFDEILEWLIQQGGDLEVANDHGYRPILYSLERKHYKCLRLMITETNSVNVSFNGKNIAHLAALAEDPDTLKLISEKAPHLLNKLTTDSEKQTALSFAILKGSIDCIRVLIDSPQINLEQMVKGPNGLISPLMLACRMGLSDTVSLLLKKGVDVKKKCPEDLSTAVHWCCFSGNVRCLILLISNGFDMKDVEKMHIPLDEKNSEFISAYPLEIAIVFRNLEVAKILISTGHPQIETGSFINLDKEIYYDSLLVASSSRGDQAKVSDLLKKLANPNSKSVVHGFTCLHEAVKNGHTFIVRELLIAGADPDITSNDGKTPLELAKSIHSQVKDRTDIIQLLSNPPEKDLELIQKREANSNYANAPPQSNDMPPTAVAPEYPSPQMGYPPQMGNPPPVYPPQMGNPPPVYPPQMGNPPPVYPPQMGNPPPVYPPQMGNPPPVYPPQMGYPPESHNVVPPFPSAPVNTNKLPIPPSSIGNPQFTVMVEILEKVNNNLSDLQSRFKPLESKVKKVSDDFYQGKMEIMEALFADK